MPMEREKDGIPREKGAERHRKTSAKGAGSGLIPLRENAKTGQEERRAAEKAGEASGRKESILDAINRHREEQAGQGMGKCPAPKAKGAER